MFAGHDLLVGKVTELSDDVAELSSAVKTIREQADADRQVQRKAIQDMRAAVSTISGSPSR